MPASYGGILEIAAGCSLRPHWREWAVLPPVVRAGPALGATLAIEARTVGGAAGDRLPAQRSEGSSSCITEGAGPSHPPPPRNSVARLRKIKINGAHCGT